MKRLQHGQRVHVLRDADGYDVGVDGVVVRLRRQDDGAWVRLDQRHERCPFPADDERRSNNLVAYPEDCTRATS